MHTNHALVRWKYWRMVILGGDFSGAKGVQPHAITVTVTTTKTVAISRWRCGKKKTQVNVPTRQTDDHQTQDDALRISPLTSCFRLCHECRCYVTASLMQPPDGFPTARRQGAASHTAIRPISSRQTGHSRPTHWTARASKHRPHPSNRLHVRS